MEHTLYHPADRERRYVDTVNRPERRHVTIMFCDLENSTQLAAMMDPEDLLYLIQAYRRLCTEVINGYDGFIAGFTGDGVMSFFGYPRTHEDNAERAAYSALDLLNAIKVRKAAPDRGNWNRISLRIGIASGPVVVGNPGETGGEYARAVIGETPNLAERLQSVAQPDTVVACCGTRGLLHKNFTLKYIGICLLRGYEKPRRLWQVVNTAGYGSS